MPPIVEALKTVLVVGVLAEKLAGMGAEPVVVIAQARCNGIGGTAYLIKKRLPMVARMAVGIFVDTGKWEY
jgi:hypothetical protein